MTMSLSHVDDGDDYGTMCMSLSHVDDGDDYGTMTMSLSHVDDGDVSRSEELPSHGKCSAERTL